MNHVDRRTFFKALGGGVLAGAVAPFLPIPAPPVLADPQLGISIRFIKAFRLGASRKIQGIFDIYNAFNARPVLGVNTRYAGAGGGAWLRPTSTLVGRLLKFGVQFDF